jgi:glycosyltransferase involved in cell wall biosynthesis
VDSHGTARDSIRGIAAVRILLDYRPALRQRTGVGAYIHETARALAASSPPDESVVLFSASWKDRLPPDVVPPLSIVDRRIPVRLLNLMWHRLEWPDVERITGQQFDVVQAAHPLLLPSRSAARLVTIYDLDFLDHPERTRAEIRRDYAALVGSHARRADQVVVISTHTARSVETRLGVPTSKITICPPGAPDWAPRAAPPSTGGCILFFGTLEPRKNLDVLLDAYSRMVATDPATPPLVLAGQIGDAAAPLVARTTAAQLAGRVELPGYVNDADKRALFDRALVFVLPSHTEGFGMPAAEAMKAGVPVVVADRGALPETVGEAGARFNPDDAAQLAAMLTEIVRSPERQSRMAEAGQRQAARFTWTHTANRLRDAWQRAREHRAARG